MDASIALTQPSHLFVQSLGLKLGLQVQYAQTTVLYIGLVVWN
jgi:hypothetical protein